MRDISLHTVNFLLLIVLSFISIYTDYRFGKIYNWLNFSGLLIGIIIAISQDNLFSSIAGIVVGFIIMFPFFVSGGMGAGDVKFAMATGAIVGARFLLLAFAIAGILILIYAIVERLGIGKIMLRGVRDLIEIFRKSIKYISTVLKLSVISGGVFIPAGGEKKKREENKKVLHRIKYGVFLGFSNIMISLYLIIEQGGIK